MQDGVMPDDCPSSSAVHDLAALGDGMLSEHGMRRLAGHVSRCRPCMIVLVSLANDAQEIDAAGSRPLGPRLVFDRGDRDSGLHTAGAIGSAMPSTSHRPRR